MALSIEALMIIAPRVKLLAGIWGLIVGIRVKIEFLPRLGTHHIVPYTNSDKYYSDPEYALTAAV